MLRRFRLLLSLAVLSACSSDPPKENPVPPCNFDEPAPGTAPVLEALVQSGSGYDPIVDGMTLQRIYGPQGGSHFYVWSRLFYDTPEPAEVQATLSADADGTTIAQGFETFAGCDGSWTRTKRITVFFQVEPVNGMTLRVVATKPTTNPPQVQAAISIAEP
ncbi:MAG: hypothetical protein H6717_40855 [Polyangiaceae bacterium]|nr:hypothetical protein [Polyangiaceae bacterium]